MTDSKHNFFHTMWIKSEYLLKIMWITIHKITKNPIK